jgi:solute carrier family 25 S-adenosylmethionine transporter 26
MISACSAEIPACLVRVPTEVLKQRMQAATGTSKPLAREVVRNIIAANGVFGLYKGFGVTIMREIPFSFIQFPLYEYIKKSIGLARGGKECSEFEAACVGSFSGGIAAALTTPLDVLKTRLMIGVDSQGVAYKSARDVFSRILQQEGWQRLFSGIAPRVTWISIGGFVYFGAYNYSRSVYLKFF